MWENHGAPRPATEGPEATPTRGPKTSHEPICCDATPIMVFRDGYPAHLIYVHSGMDCWGRQLGRVRPWLRARGV